MFASSYFLTCDGLQLDNAPADFVFVLDKIPVGRRQESKKLLNALPPNPTLYLRPIVLSGALAPSVASPTTTSAPDAPEAPAAPSAPEAPAAPDAPDVPVGSVSSTSSGSLFESIREGGKVSEFDFAASWVWLNATSPCVCVQNLKAVKDLPPQQKPAAKAGGLTGLLANAMQARRGLVEDDSRARSDSWDEDEE